MTLALLVEQLFNGVQFGLMLFLMAVGLDEIANPRLRRPA